MEDYKSKIDPSLLPPRGNKFVCTEGMIQFDETAYVFAGPFKDGYVYFCIEDYSDLCLKSKSQFLDEKRFSIYYMPCRLGFGSSTKNEEHLAKRLALLTKEEFKQWEKVISCIDSPTLETPVALYLCGNDDFSCVSYFDTIQDASVYLDLLIDNQPLNTRDIVDFIWIN